MEKSVLYLLFRRLWKDSGKVWTLLSVCIEISRKWGDYLCCYTSLCQIILRNSSAADAIKEDLGPVQVEHKIIELKANSWVIQIWKLHLHFPRPSDFLNKLYRHQLGCQKSNCSVYKILPFGWKFHNSRKIIGQNKVSGSTWSNAFWNIEASWFTYNRRVLNVLHPILLKIWFWIPASIL